MRNYKMLTFGVPVLLTLILGMSGCAQDDGYSSREQQAHGGMQGRGGMDGMGGMGQRGGHKGGPPGMDDADVDAEPELPAEAFAACEGKQTGDNVTFTLPDGLTVEATCKVVDDHLVAVPVEKSRQPHAKG